MSRPDLNRRSFLDLMLASGAMAALTAGLPLLPGIRPAAAADSNRFHFPQGLASGDPMPDRVVLWTRVEARDTAAAGQPVTLTVQMSDTAEFRTVVLEKTVTARPEHDHTVRVLVDGLKPDRTYHYRFIAPDGAVPEFIGRTRTAPAPDADRTVRLAFVSCQNFEDGFYGAYRTLLNQDKAAGDAGIDFVLHLGDQIYETVGDSGARTIPPLPSGGGETKWGAARNALTLADFRYLYRTYLSDPDYREARARFPFISIWDDHEFVNDYWQTVITYTPAGQSAPSAKLASNQAWFEYIPALLTGTVGVRGVAPAAKDFQPASVSDVDGRNAPVDDNNLLQEPNSLAAINSLTIYRSLRFGRHVELVLTDTRSYRSDHAVPDELAMAITGQATYMLPLSLVRLMDAGRTANGGNPPAMLPLGDKQVPNPRKDRPAGTLLGGPQKDWLKRTLAGSDATWKILASSVPFLPMRIDMAEINPKAETLVLTADAWDGYPTERQELMGWLRRQGITNVVALTGDHHQTFAGLIYEDYEAAKPVPVSVEFSITGIASTPVFTAFAAVASKDDNPLKPLVVGDGARFGRPGDVVEALNLTLRHGTKAAITAAKTGDLKAALAASNPRQNPHLRYVDTRSNGFGLVTVGAKGVHTALVTTALATSHYGEAGAPVLRTAHFTVKPWSKGQSPALDAPVVDGQRPFPMA
ncbi:alkaline phosphatase D family protein [Oleisolibacter albus]|uniref:alkaline phosphatase D family protein n=1 Tax=Oleisolibacter albus TaxID=2171757 RepID=UPI00138FEBD8|nr:alkaline phosphatase D family protein [Oleisolibacter albus]